MFQLKSSLSFVEATIHFPHPSQEGFEGLSDLLPLSIASLRNNVNDCVFVCSCGQRQAVAFVKLVL